MKKETITKYNNQGDNRFSGLVKSDENSIEKIVQICEFCNEEDLSEINITNQLASEDSVTCLFTEVRGIDSTNPL